MHMGKDYENICATFMVICHLQTCLLWTDLKFCDFEKSYEIYRICHELTVGIEIY